MDQKILINGKEVELLPCPFCASKKIIVDGSNKRGIYWAKCEMCGVEAGETFLIKDAVRNWNTRNNGEKELTYIVGKTVYVIEYDADLKAERVGIFKIDTYISESGKNDEILETWIYHNANRCPAILHREDFGRIAFLDYDKARAALHSRRLYATIPKVEVAKKAEFWQNGNATDV